VRAKVSLPHAFGGYPALVGGVALIVTLIANPEGIAGTGYKKKMLEEKQKKLAERPVGVELATTGGGKR
jgi:hypothetical protein